MKERSSHEESLPENSLWSSRDKEISGIWLLNKYDELHSGFYDFLPNGGFSNVNSKYQKTQFIVRLVCKSDSFLMQILLHLLHSTVAVVTVSCKFGQIRFIQFAHFDWPEHPTNSWKS